MTHTPGHKSFEMVIVSKRCVYLNDYRIAGWKPYVSENLPQHRFRVSADDLARAVGGNYAAHDDLLAALSRAVDLYGKQGGPWNVPSDPGSWIAQAKDALAKAKGQP